MMEFISSDSQSSSTSNPVEASVINNEILSILTDREKELLLRLGSDPDDRIREEVAKEIGVTKERVRQIESRAMRKLKHQNQS